MSPLLPLVLIPGMMCDARMWGGFAAPCPFIHALPVEHGTVQDLAASILANAPKLFALAGLSMGGILALEILAQAPERLDRLAQFDTNPGAEPPQAQAARDLQIAKALSGALDSVLRDEMKPNYLAAGPGPKPILDLALALTLALGPWPLDPRSLPANPWRPGTAAI